MKIKAAFAQRICFAMTLINCSIDFSGLFSTCSQNHLYAQGNQYPYKEYADRREGIIRREQLVAGEKLLLISATIESSEPPPAAGISSYNLKFYVQDTARVSVEVWEYDKSYKMEPFLRSYPTGLAKFSWSSEIPLHYKIALKDLYPLAKTLDMGQPTYLPVALYYNRPEQHGQLYSFGLAPLKSIASLEFGFYSSQASNPAHSGSMRDLQKGQKILIQWNGKNLSNQMMDDGFYTLVITATYAPRPGTHPRPPITTQYRFYHQRELLTE